LSGISFENVNITGGFWKNKQDLNKSVTVYSVRDRFRDTGRFEAYKFNWLEGQPNRPHIFWDSDIAKWIEGAAYILSKEDNEILVANIESVIDCIEANQGEDGYFNVYYLMFQSDKRFTRRDDHELYSAGHLMEAAVAYYNATGKDRFLNLMCKYADYIEKVFVTEDSAAFTTPGHEEIELALVKLYHCTGEKRYLELSKFFIDKRGNNIKEETAQLYNFSNARYNQSHLPVRNQTTAEGHSVRAGYLYSGMADIANIYSDEKLADACRTIFDNIVNKKMYITGGLGQSHIGEAFTVDYDLPNMFAYAETCAAISLIYFAQRMLDIEFNSKYSDIVELALYNGFLSGLSLDGKAFFYENPLEIDPYIINKDVSIANNHKQRFPITQRVEVFGCSCCPPNVLRLIASIGDYIYGKNDDGVYYVHQYMNSEMNDDGVSIKQTTNYPVSSKVKINVDGVSKIAVRIPGWCDKFEINQDYIIEDGYAYIENPEGAIKIKFDMRPKLLQSSPYVRENSGRVALKMGPLVYCIEEVDNGRYLRNIKLSKKLKATWEYDEFIGANVVEVDGYKPVDTCELYYDYNGNKNLESKRIKFIPYYAFANRGESEMLVWVDVK
jgi:Uncharacterized protein conserved in bacteria